MEATARSTVRSKAEYDRLRLAELASISALDELDGDGVEVLRGRVAA